MKKMKLVLFSLILIVMIAMGLFAFYYFNQESSFLDITKKDISTTELKVIGLSSALFGSLDDKDKAVIGNELNKNEIISKTPTYGLPTCKIVLKLKDDRVVEISPETRENVYAIISKNGFTLSYGIIIAPKTASILLSFEAKAQAIYEKELKEQNNK
jgi:hypothetical protein